LERFRRLSPASRSAFNSIPDAARLAPALQRLSVDLTGPDCLNSWDLADIFGLEVWLQVFLTARAGGAVGPHIASRENVDDPEKGRS
jgi:hypothetical protein